MPCDRTFGVPVINPEPPTESSSQHRFTRSGPPNSVLQIQQQQSPTQNANGDSGTYNNNLVVQTNNGLVEGYIMKTINGREIYAFEGIPYAEAPIGHLRFRVWQTNVSRI